MIPLYSSIERFSTPGLRLIALTMLKTLPARSTAASYSSLSGPAASSTSISRRCAMRRSSHGQKVCGGIRGSPHACSRLTPEVDGERDETACRNTAEHVLAGLARAQERDEQLLLPGGGEAAQLGQGHLRPAVRPGRCLAGAVVLVERHDFD